MLRRMWIVGSLGRRYILASVTYVGLAIFVISVTPSVPEVHASGSECSEEDPCGAGEQCCDGYCIDENLLCCDDGTNGSSTTCLCCALEEGEKTTILCE